MCILSALCMCICNHMCHSLCGVTVLCASQDLTESPGTSEETHFCNTSRALRSDGTTMASWTIIVASWMEMWKCGHVYTCLILPWFSFGRAYYMADRNMWGATHVDRQVVRQHHVFVTVEKGTVITCIFMAPPLVIYQHMYAMHACIDS